MTDIEIVPTPAVLPASDTPQVAAQMTVAEMRDLAQIAEVLADADILPAEYRGRPANVLVAAIQGARHGWDPVTACQQIHVIEGRAAMRPEAMLAAVRGRGHQISGSTSPTGAEVSGRRADTGEEQTSAFAIRDAARAGLCEIADDGVTTIARTKNGTPKPWQAYPADMCWARAVGALCRRLFPDVISGISYTPSELSEGQVPAAIEAPSAGARAGGDRAQIAEVVGTLDDTALAEFERRMHSKGWATVDEIPQAALGAVWVAVDALADGDIPMITDGQAADLVDLLDVLPEDERGRFLSDVTGGRTESLDELLEAEADAAITELEAS